MGKSLSKREKWAQATGKPKEQYKKGKVAFPVQNKNKAQVNYKERPRGTSKREWWAQKTGWEKTQYKQRASLPAYKPKPKRTGSISAYLERKRQEAEIYSQPGGQSRIQPKLDKFGVTISPPREETQSRQITPETEELRKSFQSFQDQNRAFTREELYPLRDLWSKSKEPEKDKIVSAIDAEIDRQNKNEVIIREQQRLAEEQRVRAEQEKIASEPRNVFNRFINNVTTDPIGTIRKVWSGEYEQQEKPIYAEPKFEETGKTFERVTEAPRVNLSKYLGSYLGGQVASIPNTLLQTGANVWNEAIELKEAKKTPEKMRAGLGIASSVAFVPFTALMDAVRAQIPTDEMKRLNPAYSYVAQKIDKANLGETTKGILKDVTSLIAIGDPKLLAAAVEEPFALVGKGAMIVKNLTQDLIPESVFSKEKKEEWNVFTDDAVAIIAQVLAGGAIHEAMKGRKAVGVEKAGLEKPKGEVPPPPPPGEKTYIPMPDITKEGRPQEVVLRPELLKQEGKPKMVDIKGEGEPKPTRAEVEFAKEPKALPEAKKTRIVEERKVEEQKGMGETEEVRLPESDALRQLREYQLTKAERVQKGLLKEMKAWREEAKGTEEVYKRTIEAQAKEEARIARWEKIGDEGLKKAIQTSEHFRKERSVRDAWRDGVVYVKNGEYRIAMTKGQKANLAIRGYRRYAGVDEIAQQKGYEDTYRYLEEVVDELNHKEKYGTEEQNAHEVLMKTDEYYRKSSYYVDKLTDRINELKQPYEGTTTIIKRGEGKVEKVAPMAEREAGRVETKKPTKEEGEYRIAPREEVKPSRSKPKQAEKPILAKAVERVKEKVAEEKKPVLAPRITGNVVDLRPKLAERVKPKEEVISTTREAERKVPEVPVEKTGVSKVGKSIEKKTIEKGLAESFDETAGYDKITIKDQAEKAANLLNSDIGKARRIVRGEENLPAGLKAGTLIKAMEDYAYAKGDVEILRELANSPLVAETSVHAQEMRMLAERSPESALTKIREVRKAREGRAGRLYKTRRSASLSSLNENVKKVNLPKEELSWNKFLNSIEC